MPWPQSALGVIKSTAVWLQQLHTECVMYFNNDSAWQQTGLSSRSLSPGLILLLLTTLMGRDSSPAACLPACLPLFWGRRNENRDGHKRERNRGSSLFVSLCSFSVVCSCACRHICAYAVLIVILYTVFAWDFKCLPVWSWTSMGQCISTVNVYSVRSEYSPTPPCLQSGFSASSRALSPSTLIQPQWLILTQAAAASNQHSQPRT